MGDCLVDCRADCRADCAASAHRLQAVKLESLPWRETSALILKVSEIGAADRRIRSGR